MVSAQMLLCLSNEFNDQSLTPEQLLENLRNQTFSGEKIDFVFSNTKIKEMIVYLKKNQESILISIQKYKSWRLII